MSNWISPETRSLTQAEMENNVGIIWNYLGSRGWTANAVSALCGNMQAESAINPGRWESDIIGRLDYGFGLVQWTPATKVRNWIFSTYESTDYTNGDYQLDRIIWELNNNQQYYPTDAYPETFAEFSKSTKTPAYLAAAFVKNYERPADQSQSVLNFRGSLANNWYSYITGLPAPGTMKIPIWLLFKIKRGRK